MRIISKTEATQLGLTRYFTGKPCKHGHLSERETRSSRCIECRRINGVQEHRKYYLANTPRLNAISRSYYANLPTEKRAQAKARWTKQRKEYAEGNRDKERLRRKEYYAENKERYLSYVHARNARKKSVKGRYTPEDIKRIRKAQKNRCAMCRTPLRGTGEIDHITPLKRGGSNYPRNLQLLCKSCNRTKHAKDPINHARSLGRLL